MTDPTTPAAELRAAAKAIRERARAATPGPWRPVAGIYGAETFAAVIGPEGKAEDAGTWLMATGHGAASQEADADHAASMHPLVGAAFADLLDAVSHVVDGATAEEADGLPAACRAAVTAARAYLGTGEQ